MIGEILSVKNPYRIPSLRPQNPPLAPLALPQQQVDPPGNHPTNPHQALTRFQRSPISAPAAPSCCSGECAPATHPRQAGTKLLRQQALARWKLSASVNARLCSADAKRNEAVTASLADTAATLGVMLRHATGKALELGLMVGDGPEEREERRWWFETFASETNREHWNISIMRQGIWWIIAL